MTADRGSVRHPDWARRANIYQVNLRQYTPEGSFAAFERHLPRLQHLGVDILWLMPIHPIGLQHRKGSIGSPYAVRDHLAVNPDHGSLADFKRLVRQAHGRGLRVILDWVANHTAWDHPWVQDHPDRYLKDAQGRIHACVYDNGGELEHWTDVVGLDYGQPAVWDAMAAALRYWVEETGIDGYRCDVAGLVPTPFWERVRAELDAIKPVFMLAEAADPALHERAFDMSYDWALHDVLRRIARGDGGPADLVQVLQASAQAFPRDAYRMNFTSNHDKNAWEGHDLELFGPGWRAFAVLTATLPGMPLIYGGQEAGLDRRLSFFERDPIDWQQASWTDFYAGLLRLKHEHAPLANGAAGAPVEVLACDNPSVFAFRRAWGEDAVSVAVNLSALAQDVAVDGMDRVRLLAPWGYHIDA